MVPEVEGFTQVPAGCAVVVLGTVILVWACGSVDYMEPLVVGGIIALGLFVAAAFVAAYPSWRSLTECKLVQSPRMPQREVSASSASSGVLLEQLLSDEQHADLR
jgi:hypothetical protein